MYKGIFYRFLGSPSTAAATSSKHLREISTSIEGKRAKHACSYVEIQLERCGLRHHAYGPSSSSPCSSCLHLQTPTAVLSEKSRDWEKRHAPAILLPTSRNAASHAVHLTRKHGQRVKSKGRLGMACATMNECAYISEEGFRISESQVEVANHLVFWSMTSLFTSLLFCPEDRGI